MRRAIRLSARGFPAPNPHVGCVLAQGERIVGEGWHAWAGGPHAETVALERAGAEAKGATAYVTLEPCAHQGRTPPCAEALIAAGVRRVVVACEDPNPVASGGVDRLRAAGVETALGVLESEAEAANRAWLWAMRNGRPYVVLKAAASLDGRIALPTGESKWITGEQARRRGRMLRAECGAVLVGSGTVRADDPHLTARTRGVKNPPVRVVLDAQASLSGSERVFDDAGPTVWCVGRARLKSQVEFPIGQDGFNLRAVLDYLFRQGVTAVLVEGGSQTLSSFLRERLANRLEIFVAPIVLGKGPGWSDGLRVDTLAAAPGFDLVRAARLGKDLWLTLAPQA